MPAASSQSVEELKERIEELRRWIQEEAGRSPETPSVPSSPLVPFTVPLSSIITNHSVRKAIAKATQPREATTAVPHSWKCQFNYEGPDAVVGSNVFWGTSTSFTGSTADCQSIATCYLNAWKFVDPDDSTNDSLITVLNSGWLLTEIVVSDNTGASDNFYVLPVNLNGTMGSPANCAPPNVAAVVSWDIDQKYKGGHPRTYLPGIDSTAYAEGGSNQWASAFVSALKAAALAFLTQLVANLLAAGFASAEPVIISRFRNGPRPSAVAFPITNSSANPPVVNSRIDSQRRRLGKEITGR